MASGAAIIAAGSFTGLRRRREDAPALALPLSRRMVAPMRWFRYLIAIVLIALGLAATALFYDRYWRWRDCFNELGRCFDPVSQDVYLEQSGLVWGSFATLFFATALVLLAFRRS